MKPLGRRHLKSNPSKTDYHFHCNRRKIMNWWEDVCTPNKRFEQRLVKKEIKEQMCEG